MTGAGPVTTVQRPDQPTSTTVVRLDGDLGLAAASALRLRLMNALRPGTRRLVLDLSRVQSCDPAGLGVLISTQRRAAERGIVVLLAAPSPPAAELLHSTGLERCLTVCPDLPGALATRLAPAGTGPRQGTDWSW
jgi:anti-sigma B factor antagonist